MNTSALEYGKGIDRKSNDLKTQLKVMENENTYLAITCPKHNFPPEFVTVFEARFHV